MEDVRRSVCSCGGVRLERVVVERSGAPPSTTDMVSCLACGSLLHDPISERERLLADAQRMARDYLKPSRQPRPGDPKRWR